MSQETIGSQEKILSGVRSQYSVSPGHSTLVYKISPRYADVRSDPRAFLCATCGIFTMAGMLAILTSLVLSLTAVLAAPSQPLVVRTTSGTFRGATIGILDRWLGIPYAQPPVENLRFKAPVPITNASRTIQNATAFGNACPQVPSGSLGAPISEDCLFLNVCNNRHQCSHILI